ncbi:hypothetical protein [Nonomuraea mesophila]|uniref:hypothetical protein n=1 Tax=Nonomuraea mesophila TaxID=2530382 RepID=UPI001C70257C|nr:hypothetical protein [Nonomuraea mesophila]
MIDRPGENFLYVFKGDPPAASRRASGGRWPRCGSSAGRDQRHPRAISGTARSWNVERHIAAKPLIGWI